MRVTRSSGAPAAGADVVFSGPATGPSIISGTARTNADGIADFVPTANTQAGSFDIQAKVSGGTGPSTSFHVSSYSVGPAVGVALASGSGQSAPAGGQAFASALVVRAVDRYGNGVGGQQIDLTSSGSIWFAPAAAWSAEEGLATTTAHTGNVARTETITATLTATGATTTFPLTVTAGAPFNIQAGSGDGEHATAGTRFANGIVVALSDLFGNPCAGVAVTFAVQPNGGAGAVLDSETVLTDASGLAAAHATANNVQGSYTVTGTYGGTTLTYNLTND